MAKATMKPNLIKDGAASAAIQAVSQALKIALAIYLARTLEPSGFGVYAFAFSTLTILLIAAELGAPTLVMKEISANSAINHWHKAKGAFHIAICAVTFTSLALMTIGLLILYLSSNWTHADRIYTMAFMLLLLPVSALQKTLAHALKGLHKIKLGLAIERLIWPAIVMASVILVFETRSSWATPHNAMAAQLFAGLVTLIVTALILRRPLACHPEPRDRNYTLSNWLHSAFPFALIAGAGVINLNTDAIMLGLFRTPEDVGVYRVASQGGLLMLFFAGAISSVLAPRFASDLANNHLQTFETMYRKASMVIVACTLPFFLVLVWNSTDVIATIFGSDYTAAALPLIIICCGYMINLSCGPVGMALQMGGKARLAARVLWITAIANIGLNLALIPPLGTTGAATSTAICVASYHLALFGIMRRTWFTKPHKTAV